MLAENSGQLYCDTSTPHHGSATSRSVFVSPTGSDSAVGSEAAPLKTLAAAQTKVSTLSPQVTPNWPRINNYIPTPT